MAERIINSKNIGYIVGTESITVPTITDDIYYSFHGRWDGNFKDWKNISEISNEFPNYNELIKFYILNNTTSSITITWEQMDGLSCASGSECTHTPVVVDFVPIPINFTASVGNGEEESSNEYDNHSEAGTGWISQSTTGIGWKDPTNEMWTTINHGSGSSGSSGSGSGSTYSGNHNNWSEDPSVDDPAQTITSIIRQKNACIVDDAMLEVHMYNGIYLGFHVRYRYAIIDGNDNLYSSQYISKYINSFDVYILDYSIRNIDASLSLSDVKFASIEVEIIPDANYSRSSFVSTIEAPILVSPYTQGIIPHLTLNGDSVIFLSGDDTYTDEGADYWDEGFNNAPHVTIMSTGFTNNVNSVVMQYQGCGSPMITREVFNGKINNDGNELIFEQGQYSSIVYTDVEYIVKLKNGIIFNYDDYQIYLVDDSDNILHTYPMNTNVTDSIELLSQTKRYTAKFFLGGSELELLNDITIEDYPNSIPYTYTASATIRNTMNSYNDNEHKLVYDTENYSIDFDTFIDSIEITPLNGLTIPLNIDHYITSKEVTVKDKDGQTIYSETLANPLSNFNVNLSVLVADNTLNQNLVTIDLKLTNKNQLSFTEQNIIVIYEKYEQPIDTLRVLSDGSEVELRTLRGNVYTSSGDNTNTYIDNIGSKNELMIDINNYVSDTINIEENGISILAHNTNGTYSIIKDKNNFTIYDKPSPIIFFITDGFTIEMINNVPIVLIHRGASILKTLFTSINGVSSLVSMDLKITNMLLGDEYSYQGDIATHSFNISLDNNIETGTILCLEATATLANNRQNTISMVGKIV